MFKQALLPETFRALQLTGSLRVLKRSYLAGGSALDLRLGHRISEDLDFFHGKNLTKIWWLRICEKPEMLVDFKWEDAKKFFHSESMRLAKSL